MILFLHYKNNKNCCIHKEECRLFHKTALFSMPFLHFKNAVEAALKWSGCNASTSFKRRKVVITTI